MSSEQQSVERRTSTNLRLEAFHPISFLQRLGTFQAPRNRDEEEERSPGLPWVQLEALFGQDVQALGLDPVGAGGEAGDSPSAMKWSRDNIRRLINALDLRTLDDKNEDEMSLIHLSLMGGQLGCAKLLFDYAAEQGVYVRLHWRNGDILGWSVRNRSSRIADFVLQRMTEQCASPEETADCLKDHFEKLIRQFPQVMQNYIMNDSFCFEHGRFEVPQSLFANRVDAPIAVLDAAPSSWRPAEGSNEVKDFWKGKGICRFIDLDSTSDTKVTAVSKFLCIDLSKVRYQQMVVKSLLLAHYPVEIFKTQFMKNFVQWRWILRVRADAVIVLIFDVLSSSLFFLFIAIAWDGEPHYLSAKKQLARSTLIAAMGAKRLPIATGRFGGLLHVGVMCCLLILFGKRETTDWDFQFAASVQCILCLLALMEDLKPFHLTGPFISMIGYVLSDIRPFMVLGTLMIVTFGAALRVLFADLADKNEEHRFRSLWLSFESTFHAILGQFESEDLHDSSGSFISVWRSLFLNLFLFIAAIVLLSLLIAVLGDTCDRVILSREAESIKSRATCLTRKTLKEYSKIRETRTDTGCFRRVMQAFLDLMRKIARLFFLIVLWFLFLIVVVRFFDDNWDRLAMVLPVLVSEVVAAFLRKKGTFLERLILRDPFLRGLNSHRVDSGVSVFWFLVPDTSSTPNISSFWEGRLIAMSNLVSERVKKCEERQERNVAKLEDSLQQRMQQMENRLSRIEGFLEQMTHSASQSNERSS